MRRREFIAGAASLIGTPAMSLIAKHHHPAPLPNAYWGFTATGDVYGGSNAGYAGPPWPGTNNDNTWNLVEAHAGKAATCVAVHLNFTVWGATPFDHARSRGAFCLLTTGLEGGATLDAVVAGTWDAAIDSWAATVAAYGQPILFRPWWEMNGNWGYLWQTATAGVGNVTAANYVSAWRHFKSRCDAQGATNLTWCWCPNIWGGVAGSPGAGLPSASPWYPGDAYVDWMGFDAYNKAATSYTWDQIVSAGYTGLQSIGGTRPIAVCEVASEEYASTSTKPAWTTDFLSKLQSAYPQVKAFLWYNVDNGSTVDNSGATDTFPIECTSATPGTHTGTSLSSAAFASGVGSSYFLANIVTGTTFPSGAKVPVP